MKARLIGEISALSTELADLQKVYNEGAVLKDGEYILPRITRLKRAIDRGRIYLHRLETTASERDVEVAKHFLDFVGATEEKTVMYSTPLATIFMNEGRIIWRAGKFDPKKRLQYEALIHKFNTTKEAIYEGDFL